MRTGLKAVVVLLVTLPMLAYVAGRLAASPADQGPRTPVILEGPAPADRAPTPSRSPRPPTPEEDEDGGVRVVNPTPTRVGEDDSGTGDDEPDAEDDDRTDDDTSGGDD